MPLESFCLISIFLNIWQRETWILFSLCRAVWQACGVKRRGWLLSGISTCGGQLYQISITQGELTHTHLCGPQPQKNIRQIYVYIVLFSGENKTKQYQNSTLILNTVGRGHWHCKVRVTRVSHSAAGSDLKFISEWIRVFRLVSLIWHHSYFTPGEFLCHLLKAEIPRLWHRAEN